MPGNNGFKISIGVEDKTQSPIAKINKSFESMQVQIKKNLVPLTKLSSDFNKFADLTKLRQFSGGLRSMTGDLVNATRAGSAFTSLFGAGLALTVTNTAKQMAQLANTSRGLFSGPTGYQQLQKLQNTASASGVMDPSQVAGAVQSVNDKLFAAATGQDNYAAQAFAKYKIPVGIGPNGAKQITADELRQFITTIGNAVSKGSLSGTQANAILNSVGAGGFSSLVTDGHTSQDFQKGFSMETISNQDAANASKLASSLGVLNADFDKLTGKITGELSPSFTSMVDVLDKGVNYLNNLFNNHPAATTTAVVSAAFGGGIIAKKLLGGIAGGFLNAAGKAFNDGKKLAKDVGKDTSAAAGDAVDLIPKTTKLAPFAIGTVANVGKYLIPFVDLGVLGYAAYQNGKDLLTTPTQFQANAILAAGTSITSNRSATNTTGMKTQAGKIQQAVSYFMSQGYSKNQAEGIVTNLFDESGLNSNAVGDNGNAHGLAQWHSDRTAAILKGTGIDVTKAGFNDQLKAVVWELKNTENAANDALLKTTTAAQAAAVVSLGYERPAAGAIAAQKRANDSQGIADIANQGGKVDVTVTLKNDGNHTATAKSSGPGVGKPKVVMPLT